MIETAKTINSYTGLPEFINQNILCMSEFGSRAYGVASKDSDYDFIGIFIPKIEHLIPTMGLLRGYNEDFGYKFHIPKQDIGIYKDYTCQATDSHWVFEYVKDGKKHEYNFYSLMKFVKMIESGHPHAIELISLGNSKIYPEFQYRHWDEVLRNSQYYYSKECIDRFWGYFLSAYKKLKSEKEWHKSGYHSYRILSELEQLLKENTITVGKSAGMCFAIRNAAYTKDQVIEYCESKIKNIEELKLSTTLREKPIIKSLMALSYEIHVDYFGTLDKFEEELLYRSIFKVKPRWANL